MENLIKYIKQGKGYGLIFLLASSIIVTTIIMAKAKPVLKDMEPKLTLIAEDFLPLTIQNKQITEPVDTYKRVDINLGNSNSNKDIFPVVLDTKTTSKELPKEKIGLFIMKDVAYVISFNDIKKIYYKDGIFDIEKFKQILQKSFIIFSIISSIAIILLHFIQNAIIALLASLIGLSYLKRTQTTHSPNFSYLMRFCSLIIAFVGILSIYMKIFFTINVGFIHILLLTIIAEIIFLNKEKNKEI